MTAAVGLLAWTCIAAGAVFCLIGGIGLLRMPDFYTRMHAASITDTLGAGLLLAGMCLHAGLSLVTVKLIFLGLMIMFTSPAATHALAKAAMHRGLAPLLDDGGETSKR